MAEYCQNDSQLVAIIGMACRLPGQIQCPSDFWDLMMAERSPRSAKVPSNRFNIDAFYHPNNERPGSLNVPGGYFLDGDPADFDPTFFGISPIEATWMDPQQRKLLEVAYEAFESAGTPVEKVSGTLTGCFIGSFTSDFQQMSFKEHDFRHTYNATGVDPGILASRIAHVFNLQGPSAVINTACSSSLSALHMACSSIRNHDCEAAIVGGSNLILTVDQHLNTAKLGILSPTSQCHTFDESADGYARAEGVGALYIKSLAMALKDGDPVRAVILSTASNSNGRVHGVGISHPSIRGQSRVIRAAYEKAGLDPSRTAYIECHGTGTPTGDPIELEAVFQAMLERCESRLPLMVGSVKPNIGHSEASSSISTIIKVVLAIEKGIIPPTAGIANLNVHVPWKEWQLHPVITPLSFPTYPPCNRVGVNAFGYGGTNSHAVLEKYQPLDPLFRAHKSVHGAEAPDSTTKTQARHHLIVFSAHDAITLQQNIKAYSAMKNVPSLCDLAYTLAERRSILSHRAFAVCREETLNSDVLDALQTIKRSEQPITVGFAFTGQGAQWPRMGSRLFDAFPSFTQTIRELDQALAKLTSPPKWTIKGCLSESDFHCLVDKPEICQPLCTAIQIGLVRLLAEWNVVPVVTVGHSSGEIAAAFAVGYISAEDAIRIAYYRGKVVASASAKGGMLAVGLGAEEVVAFLEGYQDRAVVACYNSPKSVTLSGDTDAIDELEKLLKARNVSTHKLRTGGIAYHSHHMVSVASEYRELLRTANICGTAMPRNSRRGRMISTVSKTDMNEEMVGIAYWATNIERPVLFEQAIQVMREEIPDLDTIVEIGPHPVLSGAIRHGFSAAQKPLSYLPTLKRDHDDMDQVLSLAGELWVRSSSIDISAVTRVERTLRGGGIQNVPASLLIDLPTYQWNYARKYISEARQSREHRGCRHPRHDLLGRRLPGLSHAEPQWRNILRLKDVPWLKHHILGNEAVFPAAGYFAMAFEAIKQLNRDAIEPMEIYSFTLRNIIIDAALVVPDNDDGVETLFALHRHENGPTPPAKNLARRLFEFSISSVAGEENVWNEHATGIIGVNVNMGNQTPKEIPSLSLQISGKSWYRSLLQVGFNYGPMFQNMVKIHTDHKSHVISCETKIRRESDLEKETSSFLIHPGTVDCCLQSIIASIYAGKITSVTHGFVPISIESISAWTSNSHNDEELAKINTWVYQRTDRHCYANSQLISDDGKVLLELQGVHCVAYEAAVPLLDQHSQQQQLRYWQARWLPDIGLTTISKALQMFSKPSIRDIVALVYHKSALARVLDIDGRYTSNFANSDAPMNITISGSSNKALQTNKHSSKGHTSVKFVKLDFTDDVCTPYSGATYDLIIASESASSQGHCIRNCHKMLTSGGILVLYEICGEERFEASDIEASGFTFDDSQVDGLRILVKSSVEAMTSDSISKKQLLNLDEPGEDSLLLISRTSASTLASSLLDSYTQRGYYVRWSLLQEAQYRPRDQVIILSDCDQTILTDLTASELESLKNLVKTATHVLWVTVGGLHSGQDPNYALVSGLARCLRSESVSLDLITVDFDAISNNLEQMEEIITMFADRQARGNEGLESEYRVEDGTIYISRFSPFDELNNNTYAPSTDVFRDTALDDASNLTAMAQSGKLYFRCSDEKLKSPQSTQVTVRISFLDFTEAGALDIAGYNNQPASLHAIGGIVTAIGEGVSHLRIGDRIIGLSSHNSFPFQTTLARLLCPIEDKDSLKSMVTLPIAFSTAIHGLNELAHIEEGETVLIFDNTGAAGLAAVQICRLAKASFLIITKDENTYAMLNTLGFTEGEILLYKDGNISNKIQARARSARADVIFSHRAVESRFLEDCALSLTSFARIVLFGQRNSHCNISDGLFHFTECNFFTFDLSDLFHRKPTTAARLLHKCVDLYKDGLITDITSTQVSGPFEANVSIAQSLNSIVGGISVICFDSKPIVNTIASQSSFNFNPDAVYLLIGCLGGLGRSLTFWMIDRGAKHLAFMARSGAERPAAADLISSVEARGIEVTVFQGDVAQKDDVAAALRSITQHRELRGVVNAAMVLHDKLFQSMDQRSWSETIGPKVQGSLNLHEATKALHLDFFVLMSSTSGLLGTPGQSNYSAANAFQDALALKRRSSGIHAVSLILPMVLGVGYVADNPKIEESLLRKGIYGIYEDELLAAFEVAMAPQRQFKTACDHIIVGFEPAKLAHSLAQAETKDAFWLDDPRFSTITTMIKHLNEASGAMTTRNDSIITDIRSAKSPDHAIATIIDCIRQRLARLLGIDGDEGMPESQSVASFGLDSMIGTEFRSWLFKEFGADIPYQKLLAPDLSLSILALEVYRISCNY